MDDLDPMTLILKLDLDMIKMYHHTKNEVSMSTGSKVIARTDTQTERHTDMTKTLPLPHTRQVKTFNSIFNTTSGQPVLRTECLGAQNSHGCGTVDPLYIDSWTYLHWHLTLSTLYIDCWTSLHSLLTLSTLTVDPLYIDCWPSLHCTLTVDSGGSRGPRPPPDPQSWGPRLYSEAQITPFDT